MMHKCVHPFPPPKKNKSECSSIFARMIYACVHGFMQQHKIWQTTKICATKPRGMWLNTHDTWVSSSSQPNHTRSNHNHFSWTPMLFWRVWGHTPALGLSNFIIRFLPSHYLKGNRPGSSIALPWSILTSKNPQMEWTEVWKIGEVSKKERLGKEIREVKRCLNISGKDKSIVEDVEVGKEMGTQHDDNLKHEIKTKDKEKTTSWLGTGLGGKRERGSSSHVKNQPSPPPPPKWQSPRMPPFYPKPNSPCRPKTLQPPPKEDLPTTKCTFGGSWKRFLLSWI